MKQVLQSARSGKLALKEVPDPKVRAGHLLVRTRTSLISAGTERMVVQFARKNLAAKARARPDLVRKVIDKVKRDGVAATMRAVFGRLDEPLPLGYSACGDVVALGKGTEGRFHVGQRLAIAGAGLANHADFNVVPVNLVAPVPDDVNDEEACFGTLGAIALHAVRNMGLEFGDCAAVIGAGLVGQIAVQLLALAGIRALAFDYNADRLALCRYGNAAMAWNLNDGNPAEAVFEVTGGRGCDGILIAAATESSEPFSLAAAIARDRARISLVGITGTEFSYRDFMQKELSVVVSRSYGPGRYDEDYEGRGMKYPAGYVRWTETRNLEEVVRRMSRQSDHRLAVEQLITHRFPFARAEDAYEMVTDNTEPHLGVVLTYDKEARHSPSALRIPVTVSGGKKPAGCVLGVIGAGNFARGVLLPELRKIPECRLHTLATQRGMTAQYGQETFGFEAAAADEAAVLENDEINAVLIATTHASHAALTAAALAAGKNVLVEKPLALDRDQLNGVIEARNRSDAFFQVGFNRRFAAMAIAARDRMASSAKAAPKVVLLRVNAGQLPAGNWQNAPEEGHGRILGEVCHFVDLARFLIGAPIATVHAAAATATRAVCDDLTATLTFNDGSLATIAYTAKGDTAFSKELVECYAGGTVFVIDNFRTATLIADGKQKSGGAGLDQDKGHAAQLKAFVAAIASGGRAPVDEAELIETSLATIAIGEALRGGAPVNL